MAKIFDDLSEKLTDVLPNDLKGLKDDAKKNFNSILESAFSKMNLVTREEFDAQKAVLERAREKLTALEKQLAELEKHGK